jgi:putative ABC transport system permease protein
VGPSPRNAAQVLLLGTGALALLASGINIMNVMLVTVSERRREIGLRRAIGATPRSILVQFLLEAAGARTRG